MASSTINALRFVGHLPSSEWIASSMGFEGEGGGVVVRYRSGHAKKPVGGAADTQWILAIQIRKPTIPPSWFASAQQFLPFRVITSSTCPLPPPSPCHLPLAITALSWPFHVSFLLLSVLSLLSCTHVAYPSTKPQPVGHQRRRAGLRLHLVRTTARSTTRPVAQRSMSPACCHCPLVSPLRLALLFASPFPHLSTCCPPHVSSLHLSYSNPNRSSPSLAGLTHLHLHLHVPLSLIKPPGAHLPILSFPSRLFLRNQSELL